MKIWSDKKYSTNNPIHECHMLIPFWGGDNLPKQYYPDSGRFLQWKNNAKKHFSIVENIENSNIIIFPIDPKDNNFAEFENLAKTHKKKLIMFYNSDDDGIINKNDSTLLFRTSFYKSSQKINEYALAAWSLDNGVFDPIVWKKKPKISFCGTLDRKQVRKKTIDILYNSNKIETDFIIRKSFWNGALTNRNIIHKVRGEFLENMKSNPYNLCARGGGNFSYRFYETMMYGRIPVFINTDCVLPFDNKIDWFSKFPTVNFENIKNLPDILLDFHNKNKDNFIEIQKELRSLWETYLSPTGFFSNIYKMLK